MKPSSALKSVNGTQIQSILQQFLRHFRATIFPAEQTSLENKKKCFTSFPGKFLSSITWSVAGFWMEFSRQVVKPRWRNGWCLFSIFMFSVLAFRFRDSEQRFVRVQRIFLGGGMAFGTFSSAVIERVISIFQAIQRKDGFVRNSFRICGGCF